MRNMEKFLGRRNSKGEVPKPKFKDITNSPKPESLEIFSPRPEIIDEELASFSLQEQKELGTPEILAKENPRTSQIRRAMCTITAGLIMLTTIGCGNRDSKKEKAPEGNKIEDLLPTQDAYAKQFLLDVYKNYASGQNRQQQLQSRQALQSRLSEFALRIEKGAFNNEPVQGMVEKDQMKKAIAVLDRNIADFADEQFGNGDGQVSPEEFEKLRKNPSMKDLQLIMLQQLH